MILTLEILMLRMLMQLKTDADGSASYQWLPGTLPSYISPCVIVQGTRALVDPSPLALLLSESRKVVLPDASNASNAANAANAADAPRGARLDWHAGRVDERRGGLALIRRLASL